MRRKIKIAQDLTADEILELYRKAFRKGPGRRHRVYFRFDRNDPKKSLDIG